MLVVKLNQMNTTMSASLCSTNASVATMLAARIRMLMQRSITENRSKDFDWVEISHSVPPDMTACSNDGNDADQTGRGIDEES